MPTDRTSPRRITTAERRALALRARRNGRTYDEIARIPGPDGRPLFSSRQAAQRAIAKEIRAIPREEADVLRLIECERLDALHAAAWPEVRHGRAVECPGCGTTVDREVNVAAIRVVLSVSERRAQLLGLDARHALEERAVALLADQANLAQRAVVHALAAAGFDASARAVVLGHMGDYLRVTEEGGGEPGPDGDGVPLSLVRS